MTYYSLACGALAGVFLLSGGMKLFQPDTFRQFLESLLGGRAARVLARVVPWGEVTIGLLFFTPLGGPAVWVAAAASTGLILAAIAALLRPDISTCGCFGVLDAATPHWFTLARAMSVGVVASTAVVMSYTQRSAAPTDRAYILSVGLLVGLGSGVASTVVGQILGLRHHFVELLAHDHGAWDQVDAH